MKLRNILLWLGTRRLAMVIRYSLAVATKVRGKQVMPGVDEMRSPWY